MSSGDSDKDRSYILALLLFVGAGLLAFFYLTGDSKPKSSLSASTKKKIEDSVNRHLMNTNESISLQQKKMALENAKLLYETQQKRKPRQDAYENDQSFDLSYENRAAEVAQDLDRNHSYRDSANPHDVVQAEMYDRIQNQREEEAYRVEYARQFVENARRGGYEVQLTDDLTRVKSVKPIKKNKGQMQLFGSSGEALQ